MAQIVFSKSGVPVSDYEVDQTCRKMLDTLLTTDACFTICNEVMFNYLRGLIIHTKRYKCLNGNISWQIETPSGALRTLSIEKNMRTGDWDDFPGAVDEALLMIVDDEYV